MLTKEEIINGIRDLAQSQGFYGRLYASLMQATPEQRECWLDGILEYEPKTMLDIVLILETDDMHRPLNKDDRARQAIIRAHGDICVPLSHKVAGEYIEDYDILHIVNLTCEGLEELLNRKFAEPEERQNECPSIDTIYDFLQSHPNFTAHGYIVTPKRDDYRVSLEGVEGSGCTSQDVADFARLFHWADDFIVEPDESGQHCYCWFD